MKNRIAKYSLFLLDIGVVLFSFLLVAKLRSGTRVLIANYWRSLIPFILIWIGSGVWGLKFSLQSIANGAELIRRVLKCNAVAVLILFIVMYIFGKFHYSRYIVLGTILVAVMIELFIFIGMFYGLKFHKENRSFAATRLITRSEAMEDLQSPKFYLEEQREIPTISNEAYVPPFSQAVPEDSIMIHLFQNYLNAQTELFDFINDYVDLTRFGKANTLVLNSETYFNIENEPEGSRHLFLNLHKINDFRRLNAYLIRVNQMLEQGGVFVCNGQTITERKELFYKRFTPYLGRVLYFIDFIYRRVFPKLPILQGWYFALTNGKNRALSETEIMGRFYFCGFDLIHKREIDHQMHFILRKSREPSQDTDPTFGPFISLRREGKDGKPIRVLKLRTMHPYSEYLQVYAYSVLGTEDGDKATNDFRVTSWGRVLRKLWIDELPMLVNLFKGDLKLVGVRPLSYPKLEIYPQDLRNLRRKYKPGLVPPFYAMLPKTAEGHFQTERDYLQSYDMSPFLTDWKYFWKSVWNILVKRARSN